MHLCRLTLALLLLLCAELSLAQTVTLRRYATDQGLLGLAGNCLVQTRHTALWVCTESGLYRFNGQSFQQVGLDDARGHVVSSMSEDAQGRLWVASADSLFVGGEQGFRRLQASEMPALEPSMPKLASPRWGTVVINEGNALLLVPQPGERWTLRPLFAADTLLRLPALNHVISAQADGDILWLGCDLALCRVDAQGNVRMFGPEQGVPEDLWHSFVRDAEGTQWARGRGNLVQRQVGADRFVPQHFPGVAINAIGRQAPILRDHLGRVLVRTRNGLARWQQGRWQLFDHADGLPEGISGGMLIDRGGDLWMTVDGEGLVRWTGYDWIENWDISQGIKAAPTWSITRDARGGLLLGNEHGLSRQPAGEQRFGPWLDTAGVQVVGLSHTADGSLWSVTSSGRLMRHSADGGRSVEVAKVPHTVKQLFVDRQQRVWVLTMAGVYRLDARDPLGVLKPETQLPPIAYSDIQQTADGGLWAASAKGVFRMQAELWSNVPMRINGEPASRWVSKLRIVGKDEVWLALQRPGLWHGYVQDGVLELKSAQEHGFAELLVYQINQDRAGRVWVGHNRGVDVHDGQRWSRLSQSQGLLWDDISENAFFEDNDGSIWLGTAKGASHILAPQRLFSPAAPILTISNFSRGGQSIQEGQRLPWSEQQVQVELSALGFYDDPGRASIRYRVVGLHDDWINTQNFVIQHPPLPAGHYRLEVQLLDRYRHDASAPVSIMFSVAPLWWRGPLALIAYALLAILGLVGIWCWRHRSLLARERNLAHLIAERTRELEQEKRELENARAALALKASRDDLTGMLNRAGILEAMVTQMAASTQQGTSLAIVLLDLDHFKLINDEHGHLVGDAVLAKVGKRLNACLRESGTVGRYGGEELLAVLPGMPRNGRYRLHVIHDAISRRPYEVLGHSLGVTCSIGVAWYRDGESVTQFLMRADQALYRAKRQGRNRIELEENEVVSDASAEM